MATNRLSSIFNRPNGTSNGSAPPDNATELQSASGRTTVKVSKESKKGIFKNLNTSSLSAIVDLIRNKESVDDRKLFLEHALVFTSRLDEGPFATSLKNKIVQLLYNDLTHPAGTSLSNQYAWRTADGSYNNIHMPDMGKAGTPYSRSVQQSNPLPKDHLPDAGLVFDTLLKRDGFVEHPGGLSSLMFAFAALVIHSVFRTSHRDMTINETSSYVDLAPLYGNNQKDQDKLRIRDGRGKLHPDVFAEDRLLLLPPAVCVLLVLFNRNHNYIADKLLEINERGTFVDPSSIEDEKKRLEQDEEIFQTTRLINCGWFGTVVFSDYFSSILGLVREGSSWSLTPFDEIRLDDHSLFERGAGNICSVEFNCLYRWHSTTSQQDEDWTETVFKRLFGDKTADDITVDDFKQAAMRVQRTQPDVTQWTFGDIKRQEDGSFNDDDLANILHNATEHPAAAFRARGVPHIMRLNEIMGLEQSRRWGVCSMNDFRKYLGLKPFETFEDWNSDPEIASAAEKLYGDINYLELYVGLQAEEAKPLVEGAGLCPGYTISRAILSDAIALTRGDRFFTHDFTPFNLTSWGFADCQRDPHAFGFGSTLGRLFLRTLPDNFTENSVYTFFPLMTPDSMKVNLKNLGLLDQYDLSRPGKKSDKATFHHHAIASAILSDADAFSAVYHERSNRVIHGKGFFPAESEKEQQAVLSAFNSPDLTQKIGEYFYTTTQKLIEEGHYTLVGGKVAGIDLVRQVLRVVPSHWVATELAGIELKTAENDDGDYTASELFDILGEIYEFVFLDVEASRVKVLEAKVQKHVTDLLRLIKSNLGGTVGSRLSIAGIVGTLSNFFSKPKSQEHRELLNRLYELGHSTDKLANTILALMIVSGVELVIATTNTVNYYLSGEHNPTVSKLVKDRNDRPQLDKYVYEALRLDPIFRGVHRLSSKDHELHGHSFKKGDRIFVDVASANVDETMFADGSVHNVARPTRNRLHADGVFKYLGEDLTIRIVSEVLRAVLNLKNVKRAPGQSGVLKRFRHIDRSELNYAYIGSDQQLSAFPRSLSIQFDK